MLLLLGLALHVRYLKEFPAHIHAWAQSDHYALALGFVDNGLDFFHPQTFVLDVLNTREPDPEHVFSRDAITAVDFPLHNYIPALLMKLLGSQAPWIYRLYVLLYSMLGLFFLYRLAMLMFADPHKALLVVGFAATSPVFVYYQSGFLPSIPSIANTIMGLFFYTQYLQGQQRKDLRIALFFLTLAALARTTFVIPLLSVLAAEFVRMCKKQTPWKSLFFSVLLALSPVALYLAYNAWLRQRYGGMFLHKLLPAENMAHAWELLARSWANWGGQYFSGLHYLLMGLVFLTGLLAAWRRHPKLDLLWFQLLLPVLFMLGGCVAFAVAMLRQFPDHDYYFLDTFFLPVVLLLMLFLAPLRFARIKKVWITLVLALVMVILVVQAMYWQQKRRASGPWDHTATTIQNYQGSAAFLDSLGVAAEATVLSLDSQAPNIPFILMNRKGYAVIWRNAANLQRSLEMEADYVVWQPALFFTHIYAVYPEFISRVEKIADNGRIAIGKLRESAADVTLEQFWQTGPAPLFECVYSYEPDDDSYGWENIMPSDSLVFQGQASGVLPSDALYGLTFRSTSLDFLHQAGRLMVVSGWFYPLSHSLDCYIRVSLVYEGEIIYYQAYNLEADLAAVPRWQAVNMYFALPQIGSGQYEFALYVHNPAGVTLLMDDFGFRVY